MSNWHWPSFWMGFIQGIQKIFGFKFVGGYYAAACILYVIDPSAQHLFNILLGVILFAELVWLEDL
jgi:hypothetical protein